MTETVAQSWWSADPAPLLDRAEQACAVIGDTFGIPTFWSAGHKKDFSAAGEFAAKSPDEVSRAGGKLTTLLGATRRHFEAGGLDPELMVAEASVYSNTLDLSVRVFFNEAVLSIEAEPPRLKKTLQKHKDTIHGMLQRLGARPAITAIWLRNQAAFAGRASGLYLPAPLSKKLGDLLDYKKVIEEVREIRRRQDERINQKELLSFLKSEGLVARALEGDRLYVELGDPLKTNAREALRKLEPWFKRLLA